MGNQFTEQRGRQFLREPILKEQKQRTDLRERERDTTITISGGKAAEAHHHHRPISHIPETSQNLIDSNPFQLPDLPLSGEPSSTRSLHKPPVRSVSVTAEEISRAAKKNNYSISLMFANQETLGALVHLHYVQDKVHGGISDDDSDCIVVLVSIPKLFLIQDVGEKSKDLIGPAKILRKCKDKVRHFEFTNLITFLENAYARNYNRDQIMCGLIYSPVLLDDMTRIDYRGLAYQFLKRASSRVRAMTNATWINVIKDDQWWVDNIWKICKTSGEFHNAKSIFQAVFNHESLDHKKQSKAGTSTSAPPQVKEHDPYKENDESFLLFCVNIGKHVNKEGASPHVFSARCQPDDLLVKKPKVKDRITEYMLNMLWRHFLSELFTILIEERCFVLNIHMNRL